ncbi:hypothetical protein [Geomonas subterranea]|uniref:hypothetical protein n=1 Tax=Geomonas subterranea TaxID=2847989 RepID=UPI001C490142|nr:MULTISPECIES: hypothetical protein [Geomonas]QXM11009.1 hypothetical protein KP002_07830 [Geomonas subterranea]
MRPKRNAGVTISAGELSGFDTTVGAALSFDVVADKFRKVPAEITEGKLCGIDQTAYYKTGR